MARVRCEGMRADVGAAENGRGRVKVRVGLLLLEGSRCARDIGDSGNLDDDDFVLGPNQSKVVKLSADHAARRSMTART